MQFIDDFLIFIKFDKLTLLTESNYGMYIEKIKF